MQYNDKLRTYYPMEHVILEAVTLGPTSHRLGLPFFYLDMLNVWGILSLKIPSTHGSQCGYRK